MLSSDRKREGPRFHSPVTDVTRQVLAGVHRPARRARCAMTIFHLIDAPLALPALTPVAAASASSLLTLAYVGNLYVSTATRIGKARSKDGVLLTKDDAVVVRSRLRVASWTTVGAWAATLAVVRRTALRHVANPLLSLLASLRLTGVSLPVPSVLHGHALPFQPSVTLYTLHHVLPSILVPLALTSVLFAGPLIVSFLDGRLMGQHRGGSWKEALHDKLGNIWGLRNYLVGPLTEEVVFRGCVLALHALAGVRKPALVFATPLYFGFGACWCLGQGGFFPAEISTGRLTPVFSCPLFLLGSSRPPCVRELCQRGAHSSRAPARDAALSVSVHLYVRLWLVCQLSLSSDQLAAGTDGRPCLLQHHGPPRPRWRRSAASWTGTKMGCVDGHKGKEKQRRHAAFHTLTKLLSFFSLFPSLSMPCYHSHLRRAPAGHRRLRIRTFPVDKARPLWRISVLVVRGARIGSVPTCTIMI